MKYSVLLTIVAGIIFLGSLVAVQILTRNLSKIRRNFYRAITYFIVMPLFFLSTTIIGWRNLPKPIDLPTDSVVTKEIQEDRIELQRYAEDIGLYLEYERFMFFLMLIMTWSFSLLPTVSVAYYYMKHLEQAGIDNEVERIL